MQLDSNFVQWTMNSSYLEAFSTTPYKAFTGKQKPLRFQVKVTRSIHGRTSSDIEEEELDMLMQDDLPLQPDSVTRGALEFAVLYDTFQVILEPVH